MKPANAAYKYKEGFTQFPSHPPSVMVIGIHKKLPTVIIKILRSDLMLRGMDVYNIINQARFDVSRTGLNIITLSKLIPRGFN